MLTREQVYTMLLLRMRKKSIFSALPKDLIKVISDIGQTSKSEIATALHHAAYARKENVEVLLAMLHKNPRLLLQAGNVQTPGGDEVRRVTLYEFLLGASDYELAEKVQTYFAKIKHGEKERILQYERYRPHIESMLTQEPYNIVPLIKLIKKAPPEQVRSLLQKDVTGDDDLCKAFIQFRMDWRPRTVTKPGMHYNYASLQHAFDTLDREWGNLNMDQIHLVWRQLIGFEMRRLPGIDRCIMAQGMFSIINKEQSVVRSYRAFPTCTSDDSIDGLGWDFAVDMMGSVKSSHPLRGGAVRLEFARASGFGSLMLDKKCKLSQLRLPRLDRQEKGCILS